MLLLLEEARRMRIDTETAEEPFMLSRGLGWLLLLSMLREESFSSQNPIPKVPVPVLPFLPYTHLPINESYHACHASYIYLYIYYIHGILPGE